LLWLDAGGKLSLAVVLPSNKIPPYAILSHTWGPDSTEVIFRDLAADNAEGKSALRRQSGLPQDPLLSGASAA
jgi:hypothetical protein